MEDHENYNTYDILASKLSAVNNKVRFSILEILSEIDENNQQKDNIIKEPLYSRELNSFLLKRYEINITPQMLGQHLKQLEGAKLIEEVHIKKEVPNKIGPRTVKAYKINTDAFKDLFLDVNLFTKELLSLFKLYESHEEVNDGEHCILTVLNGVDKGKTFKLNKEDKILVGCKEFDNQIISSTILLDSKYSKVSSISNPHAYIFYQENQWIILDKDSKNGTFIDNKLVYNDCLTKLKNKSFLRFSKGTGSAVFFCSFE
ncbi:MAG: FHA domain-containing protein [Methanosphaera stadtmanae]|nr:FHA domain-containing protein [Methanosphaera stadtmanae]